VVRVGHEGRRRRVPGDGAHLLERRLLVLAEHGDAVDLAIRRHGVVMLSEGAHDARE
jgi:hypothetical protein